MKAQEILFDIESQVFAILEHYKKAVPGYVVMSKENYRILARHFKKMRIRGFESNKISKRMVKDMIKLDHPLKIIAIDHDNVLQVSALNPEDMFERDDPAVWEGK
jgi:hypothetical protein